jgi:hypothetical protein
MRQNYLSAFCLPALLTLLLATSLLVLSCKPTPIPELALTISSVSPGSGMIGTVVTITGTGFDGSTPTANQVQFGTTSAPVTTATSTTLVTLVPGGITGNQPIVVTNLTKGASATFTTPFNVIAEPPKSLVEVTTSITANQTWTADKGYLLKGCVYVRAGVTLTIQPGTVIRGDKLTKGTLIIEPGATINAIGTASNPIVFTSNLPPGLRNLGDWGGLVICGRANHNAATGQTDPAQLPQVEGGIDTRVSAIDGQRNPADNSGTLRYVRIEWAGVSQVPNTELDGLSLWAVGSGTTIDHVQVSYANDDSFQWHGGSVNMSHLIAYRGIDDDFDSEDGYVGNVQFGLGVRDITIADGSGSKALESDNDALNSGNQPQTSCVFSNMTLVGPTAVTVGEGGSLVVDPTSRPPSPVYVAAVHIRRNSALSLFNSVLLGWPAGVLLDGSNVATNMAAGRAVIAGNLIGGNLTGTVNLIPNSSRDVLYIPGAGGAGSLTQTNTLGPDSSAFGLAVGPVTYLRQNGNLRLRTTAEFLLTDPFAFPAPNVLPLAASAALTGTTFTHPKLASAFFNKTVPFQGAVGPGSNFTTEAWVNFTPQTTIY